MFEVDRLLFFLFFFFLASLPVDCLLFVACLEVVEIHSDFNIKAVKGGEELGQRINISTYIYI